MRRFPPTSYRPIIPRDIRGAADQSADVDGGRPFDNSPAGAATLFSCGRETWTFPTEAEAIQAYTARLFPADPQ
jgi:hypothetical protein